MTTSLDIYTQSYPVHEAAKEGNIQGIHDLLNEGMDVNAVDEGHTTPLHEAAKNGHSLAIKVLIEERADVRIEDVRGNTALHCASITKDVDGIKALIKAKANVNARNFMGTTPLHGAGGAGHVPSIDVLIEAKAHVDVELIDRTLERLTPLSCAAFYEHLDACRALIQRGASISGGAETNLIEFLRKKNPQILDAKRDSSRILAQLRIFIGEIQ